MYACIYSAISEDTHSIVYSAISEEGLTVIEHPQIVDLGFGLGVEESFVRYAQMGQQLMGWVEYTHVHKLLYTRAFILQC